MAKHPYFSFYPTDFLTGTALMDATETGAYIRLLCHSWESDGLPNDPKILKRLAGCPASKLKEPLKKFTLFSDEKLRNSKQELIRSKLKNLSEKQSQNASKRWKKHQKEEDLIMPPHMPSHNQSHMPSQSHTKAKAKTKENTNTNINSPSIEEVISKAEIIGLAEWKAKDWWEEMETCGWLTYNGHHIKNWQTALSRVATKWRADGCPETAEKALGRPMSRFDAKQGSGGPKTLGSQIYALDKSKEAIEKEMTKILRIHTIDTAIGTQWTDDEKRKEYFNLKKDLSKIEKKLRDAAKD
jgi:uncharacterized protein YdaU (DUF1376 family)